MTKLFINVVMPAEIQINNVDYYGTVQQIFIRLDYWMSNPATKSESNVKLLHHLPVVTIFVPLCHYYNNQMQERRQMNCNNDDIYLRNMTQFQLVVHFSIV